MMAREFDTLCRVLDVLPDGVVMVDDAQRIVYANRVAEQLFGYAEGELVNSALERLIPSRSRRIHERLFTRAMTTGIQRPMGARPILTGVRKSGDEIRLSIAVCDVAPEGRRMQVAVVRDQSRLFSELDQARSAASTDPLTGIGNRRCLSTRLASLRDGGSPFALLYLDLDRFKQLNDRHGHACGDAVLRVVAQRITSCLRKHDTCARIGGDEFVVVIGGIVARRELHAIAGKVCASVTESIHLEQGMVTVGVSAGAVICRHREPEQALMARADAAMYRAKRNGGRLHVDDSDLRG